MITTLVQFKLPTTITREEAQQLFLEVAPMFYDIPGLIRKYFLLFEDGMTTGGIYLWESRQDAERFHSDNFRQMILERYGSEPTITYYESPVVIDNLIGETIAARYLAKRQ
ncbi:MAG: YdhR family protein [Microcystaceae cyanobacterium]